MVKDRNTAVLYTSGVCNLNCRYCSIDKNPVLKEIDNILAESFEGDYYFEEIKKAFPNRGQLEKIETWGGEPFLYMERIHPLLENIIEYFPYFSTFYSSTNFSYPSWNDKVYNLFKLFGKYPNRDFNFILQLSCDGPEELNDAGRGIGTTKKCLENFNIFLEKLEYGLPPNVDLYISVKATMDIVNLKTLNTKEKIINYYKFFEDNFIEPVKKLGFSNVSINHPIPNCAVPIPATKEDGLYFADYCKKCREIEKENVFKYYENITMFSNPCFEYDLTYNKGYNLCGTGASVMGFLPNKMYSSCHEGFTHFLEKYKKFAASSKRTEKGTINFDKFIGDSEVRFCLNEEQYLDYEEQIKANNNPYATAFFATLINEICLLAMVGQIDKKYIFPEEAIRAASFFVENAPCVKDNYNTTGSITLTDYGLIKIFFNGAFEYIINEKEV